MNHILISGDFSVILGLHFIHISPYFTHFSRVSCHGPRRHRRGGLAPARLAASRLGAGLPALRANRGARPARGHGGKDGRMVG